MRRILLFLLLFAGFVQSAVVFDATSSKTQRPLFIVDSDTGIGIGIISLTHVTTYLENRIICGGTSWTYTNIGNDNVWIENITYGGILVPLIANTGYGDQINCLVNPSTGSNNWVVTWLNNDGVSTISAVIGVATFSGVNQTNSTGATPSGSGVSNNVMTTFTGLTSADDMLFDNVWINVGSSTVTVTPATLQTSQWSLLAGTAENRIRGAGSRKQSVGSTTTMNWTLSTSKTWHSEGVEIKAGNFPAPPSSGVNPVWNNTAVQASIDEEEEGGKPWYAWILQLFSLWK